VRMYARHAAPLASFIGTVSKGCIQGPPGSRADNTRAIALFVKPEAPTPAGEWDGVTYARQGEVVVALAEGDDGLAWEYAEPGQRVVVLVVPIPPEAPWPAPGVAAKGHVDRWADAVFADALRGALDPDFGVGAANNNPHGVFRGLLCAMGSLAVYAEPNSARGVAEGFVRMALRMAILGEADAQAAGWQKRFRSGLMTTLADARRSGVDVAARGSLYAALAMDVGQIGFELAGHHEGDEVAPVVRRVWPLLLRCCAGALSIARRAENDLFDGMVDSLKGGA